jgi:hypothetical protein
MTLRFCGIFPHENEQAKPIGTGCCTVSFSQSRGEPVSARIIGRLLCLTKARRQAVSSVFEDKELKTGGSQPIYPKVVFLICPRGALMREFHRFVVINGQNEIAVRLQQLQFADVIDGIPERWSHDNRARWIVFPDKGQCLVKVQVPKLGSQLFIGFIEHIKKKVCGSMLVREESSRQTKLIRSEPVKPQARLSRTPPAQRQVSDVDYLRRLAITGTECDKTPPCR